MNLILVIEFKDTKPGADFLSNLQSESAVSNKIHRKSDKIAKYWVAFK